MSKIIKTWWQEINPGDKLPEGYDFAALMEQYYAKSLQHYAEDLGNLVISNSVEALKEDIASPDSYILLCKEHYHNLRSCHSYWWNQLVNFREVEKA